MSYQGPERRAHRRFTAAEIDQLGAVDRVAEREMLHAVLRAEYDAAVGALLQAVCVVKHTQPLALVVTAYGAAERDVLYKARIVEAARKKAGIE